MKEKLCCTSLATLASLRSFPVEGRGHRTGRESFAVRGCGECRGENVELRFVALRVAEHRERRQATLASLRSFVAERTASRRSFAAERTASRRGRLKSGSRQPLSKLLRRALAALLQPSSRSTSPPRRGWWISRSGKFKFKFVAIVSEDCDLFLLTPFFFSDAVLQKTLDYTCGAGADCSTVLQNGACYNPNTVKAHCYYATNSYFQSNGEAQGACDCFGTATRSTTDPSQLLCLFLHSIKLFCVNLTLLSFRLQWLHIPPSSSSQNHRFFVGQFAFPSLLSILIF
ncbi:hypothetical protein ZIOFF_046271 [Zingiber officinale]|uniref:X8 domain-containing protein n=1 Tax=Zingiber officinale TaxID=94328 RepID=A0A8J5G598_ZINOF|nr:hypothetical protein ZIOFF_046271 [Zingiber officinale]